MHYIITEYIYHNERGSSSFMIKWALLEQDHFKNRFTPVLIADTKELLYQKIEERFGVDILDSKKAQLEQKISPEILKAIKDDKSISL